MGAAIGIGPEVALALSLIKRVRELVIGVPALLAWQLSEGKNLFFTPSTASASDKGNIQELDKLVGTEEDGLVPTTLERRIGE